MGSHWVQKWVKTVKNYHAPEFKFSTSQRSLISAKIRLDGYDAKSRWGTPRVHLEANGVSLGKKMGQNRKKLPCPKIRIFDYPAVIDFGQNWTFYGYGAISPRGPPSVHLGAIGVPLGTKMGQNRKKITMPQNSNFRLSRGHRLRPKLDFTVMAPNHGGDTIVSILGPKGSHLVKKIGQKQKKLPCPKIRIVDYTAVIDFGQNSTMVMVPYHGGDPLGSILGPMGSHWVQKMGQNRKKLPCPKIRIFDYPAVIDFGQNWTLGLWRQITVGTP